MTIEIMSKLVKQRKESIKSYQDGGRPDLAEDEQRECDVITSYLPKQLSGAEVDQLIIAAIAKVGAATVKDMGKVSFMFSHSVLWRKLFMGPTNAVICVCAR